MDPGKKEGSVTRTAFRSVEGERLTTSAGVSADASAGFALRRRSRSIRTRSSLAISCLLYLRRRSRRGETARPLTTYRTRAEPKSSRARPGATGTRSPAQVVSREREGRRVDFGTNLLRPGRGNPAAARPRRACARSGHRQLGARWSNWARGPVSAGLGGRGESGGASSSPPRVFAKWGELKGRDLKTWRLRLSRSSPHLLETPTSR